ncbi:MAG: rhodanese-like domain-containing protein [Sulfurimonadaceae bacterium]|nr:rhodanese-like domain-containing protein [Sulfurimonadaceae bacterium]
MKLSAFLMTGTILLGANIASLQYQRLAVDHPDGKSYVVERHVPAECLEVGITPEQVWKKEDVPSACLQSFVATVGNITKIAIRDDVQIYGELEVMAFLKKVQRTRSTVMLVDSRGEEWYEHETIPGAVNIWYKFLTKPDVFPEEYRNALRQLHIIENGSGRFDFSNAPVVLLFCNGPWCSQSPRAINALLNLGYPPDKIKWYRGGIHSWKSLSLTTTAIQAQ